MGGNAVKTIVLLMVLVVLSLLVGTQVSDGLKDSVGAFAVIAVVVGGFLLLFLGRNAWWLIFLLPPALSLLQINVLSGSMGVYAMGLLVLFFNLIQGIFMRQQQLTWHKLVPFDVLFVIISIYTCVSYYRHPVYLEIMGDDVDTVGAKAYVIWLLSVLYFFCLSSLSVKSASLEKILRVGFWIAVVLEVVRVIIRYRTGNIYWSGDGEDGSDQVGFGERRISVLTNLAGLLLPYCYASLPLLALLRSPLRLAGILFSMYGISLAGARGVFLYTMINIMGISWIKKELAAFMVMGVAAWGTCFVLGNNGVLQQTSTTFQRMLCILPGVEVAPGIALETARSSEVRVVAWKMALDTRAGYITDYVWGDGFQVSKKTLDRDMVAAMRGVGQGIGLERGNDALARTGMWHNLFITVMHRMGLVACVLFYVMILLCSGIYLILGNYYRGKPFFAYYCATFSSVVVPVFNFFTAAGTVTSVFSSFNILILLKLLYTLLCEEGKLQPFNVLRRRYVPILIREHSSYFKG